MEQSLTDTQRELAELRHPPEPEGGGFFSAVFGGGKKKEGVEGGAVVNDAEVRAVTRAAAGRLAVPGGAAMRTAEVGRRMAGASGWLKLATTPVESAAAVSGSALVGDSEAEDGVGVGDAGWGSTELSQMLLDLATPGSALPISAAAEAVAIAATAASVAATPTATSEGSAAGDRRARVRVYRCAARTTVRAGPALNSAKAGVLAVGEEIESIEEIDLEQLGGSGPGVTRVRFHMGWVSKSGGAGSRKASQDKAAAGAEAAGGGTAILEEVLGDASPRSSIAPEDGGAGVADAGGATVAQAAVHAALVLGGPYTSDTQVVFCPGLRLDRQDEAQGEELVVSWLRRHAEGEWSVIAGAHGWSYSPCAADVDCEMQAVVRAVGAPAEVKVLVAGGAEIVDEQVKRAQQARLDRLGVPAGAGVPSRVVCVALSPPLRTDPLTAKQAFMLY